MKIMAKYYVLFAFKKKKTFSLWAFFNFFESPRHILSCLVLLDDVF